MGGTKRDKAFAFKIELFNSFYFSVKITWMGVGLTEEGSTRLNTEMKGMKYLDEDLARTVHSINKIQLNADLLVKLIEIGGANRCWTDNHIICHMKDVIDCVKFKCSDSLNYCLLFDHGIGHEKEKRSWIKYKEKCSLWRSDECKKLND